jgi:hypothetical protein
MFTNNPRNQHSAYWLQYSKGLIGYPIDISIEATRRALSARVSRKSIIEMLEAGSFKIQIARARVVSKSERYKYIVLKYACYLEKIAKQRQ